MQDDAPDNLPAPAPPAPAQATLALPQPRLGIVGCGQVGDVHRDRLLAEGVEIVAVCDPDSTALARMAGSLPRRPRLFRSETDLLAAGVVDAVVLCTPHGRHAGQIRAALDAGVHVLCEKPFVTHANEAEELVAQARAARLALFVAYTRRSRGHANFLLEAAQRIGPIENAVVLRSQPWLQTHRRTWRMHESEGGGFLLDAGVSMLDLLLRFTGSTVSTLDAQMWRPGGSLLDVDIRSSLRLEFASGARADLTFIGDGAETVEVIQLFGPNGSAAWHLHQDAPAELYIRLNAPVADPGAGETTVADATAYRVPLPDTAFIAALRDGQDFGLTAPPGLYSAASAVPVVGLVERIYAEAIWR